MRSKTSSETSPLKKPSVDSASQKELDKVEKQFESFNEQVQSMTLDRMNMAPKEDTDQQTKLSKKQAQDANSVWLKPTRTISSKEKFNERFRKDYEFSKEYVRFIAENKEIIGESVHAWTKPFPGLDAEEWTVPVNKPVMGPRYLAEQIRKCAYHRMSMQDTPRNSDGMGTYYGTMTVDKKVQRLDAYPVSEERSIFMGASGF